MGKRKYMKKTNKQTNNEAKQQQQQQQKEEKERIKLSVEPARPVGGGGWATFLYLYTNEDDYIRGKKSV